MSIVPDHGLLNAGKAERVNVSLRRSQDASEARELNGIWFTARVGGSDTLIPIFMNTQLSQPCIDIDFGAGAIHKGRHVCIPLWPSSDSQDLRWLIRCIDPAIKLVAVSVISQGGESLVSQPIALKGDQSMLISFPPPKPVEPNHSSPKSFEGPLTVIVSDSKDGKPLGSWQVTTQIGDPRTMLQPGTAEYVIRDDGTNRIRVDVEHLTKFDTRPVLDFAPIVRLELESAASQSRSLIDIGNSKLQAVIKDGQSPTTLYAENLRFIEGAPAMMMIPLSINGDCGYFELEGLFPRRSGTVKLSWARQPRLRIRAANSTSPAVPLQATIEARNLDDDAELMVEVINAFSGASERIWHTRLSTSRRTECRFAPAGPAATLSAQTIRDDWTISIPSDYGTGEYLLRVFTVLPTGNVKPLAEHRFLIDDKVPTRIQARADVESDRTIVHIACQPSASGIISLSLQPSSSGVAEKIEPMVAQRIDTTGSRWQIKWPSAIPTPEQLDLTFTTGAGKEHLVTCDLQVQTIAPVGKVVGQVLEGSIAQPHLAVTLRNLAGSDIAKYMTDGQGHFEFSVPPGQYQLATEKVSTRRKAVMQVFVGQGESRKADLILQRSGPGGV